MISLDPPFHIKVKVGDRPWRFLAAEGVTPLRVHALEYEKLEHARTVADLLNFGAGISGDVKIVTLDRRTVYTRHVAVLQTSTKGD